MSELEKAIDRLGRAIAELRDSTGGTPAGSDVEELASERDALQAKVIELKSMREEDAKLRAEAADAVRIALTDLRSIAEASAKQRKATRKKAS